MLILEIIAIDSSLTPSLVIADAVKRSTVAHLFHLYPVLCDIASIPRKTPSAWIMAPTSATSVTSGPDETKSARRSSIGNDETGDWSSGKAIELDARVLARGCLKEVGKEMGVGR